MNTVTETCSRSLASSPAGVLETLGRSIRCWFEYQQLKRQVARERAQLLVMTDAELKDLGISRHDAVVEAARVDVPLQRIS